MNKTLISAIALWAIAATVWAVAYASTPNSILIPTWFIQTIQQPEVNNTADKNEIADAKDAKGNDIETNDDDKNEIADAKDAKGNDIETNDEQDNK